MKLIPLIVLFFFSCKSSNKKTMPRISELKYDLSQPMDSILLHDDWVYFPKISGFEVNEFGPVSEYSQKGIQLKNTNSERSEFIIIQMLRNVRGNFNEVENWYPVEIKTRTNRSINFVLLSEETKKDPHPKVKIETVDQSDNGTIQYRYFIKSHTQNSHYYISYEINFNGIEFNKYNWRSLKGYGKVIEHISVKNKLD